ncbi:MAG TPA: bifunctional riboflavin kinase/FAD synthetase [Gammaproteobacteria bacterium]|nr:bifunctional riboflavin kinase/FAD synthetase [Gammaproteobacteria bacterium]
MRLYRTFASLPRPADAEPRAVAIGVFDGLHIGHRAILERARGAADDLRGSSLVLTFEPTPKEFFSPETAPPRLTRFRERFELLEGLGLDELFCAKFGAVRELTARAFIDELLVAKLGARHVVVGDDFRFGADRLGTVEELRTHGRRHGLTVSEVPPVYWNGERVSSTAIRQALKAGDLATARSMLGRDYSISGRVVRGLGLGRKLGFPTANVNLKRLQAPIDGIFAARVAGLGDTPLDGVASVGTRPTIGGGTALLEVLIFDFDRDIYGRYITVQFLKRLREERHFDDLESLKRQMHIDVAAARAALTD